jgi:hypothetical protein
MHVLDHLPPLEVLGVLLHLVVVSLRPHVRDQEIAFTTRSGGATTSLLGNAASTAPEQLPPGQNSAGSPPCCFEIDSSMLTTQLLRLARPT